MFSVYFYVKDAVKQDRWKSNSKHKKIVLFSFKGLFKKKKVFQPALKCHVTNVKQGSVYLSDLKQITNTFFNVFIYYLAS